jgi:hypothetical protein
MPATARVGDRTYGICYHSSHRNPIRVGGAILTGDAKDLVDNQMSARMLDLVRADCGHISKIITGSPKTFSIQASARIGDNVGAGPYIATIITGSPKTFSDG